MDSAAREALAARVLALSTADQTEVLVQDESSELTRFTHNTIHQNVASIDTAISVRAVLGGRTGVARTNLLDDAALRDVAERALTIAKLAPEDPHAATLPSGGSAQAPAGAYVAATAEATPDLRARLCATVFEIAQADDLWAAGYATTSRSGVTIANSSGACASYDGTDAGLNVKMNGTDSTGFGEAYDADVTRIDAHAVGSISAQKARASAKPRAVEPGAWTVILEHAAFGELFAYLADHFSAQAFDEGSSFLSDGLDKAYLGENVTIRDNYAHPLAPGMPFDWEGQPTQRLALIERGVARNIVTDSYWAKKLGRSNTGHALPAPNAYGPQALHLAIDPGSKSTQELIAQTERGLLISRFWYIRTVDQKKAIVTGMTRDGTFLIENGKIAAGVNNMRFNYSILDALRNCELSNEPRRTGGYSYSVVVPTAKITGFTFSSGTEF